MSKMSFTDVLFMYIYLKKERKKRPTVFSCMLEMSELVCEIDTNEARRDRTTLDFL